MRVVITKIDSITGKKGNFVKLSGLSCADGSAVSVFTTKETFDRSGYDLRKVATNEDIQKIISFVEESDVQFDQDGRFVSLT